MPDRILVIDDDHNLLSSFRRQFQDKFDLTTAEGGEAGIAAAQAAQDGKAPFAVVISDMRMPGLDGIETLKRVREVSPESVRMMLTGNADQQTASTAINRGNIFRFYNKPVVASELMEGIEAGIEQHRLITAERDLLQRTLAGSVKVLTDFISFADPAAHARTARLQDWITLLTEKFKMPKRWQLEMAASLVPIGRVAIPADIVAKRRAGEALTEVERSLIERTPEVARGLVANIPRLEKVAEIVYLQDRGYDGSGFPADGPAGKEIPLDARLLKLLKDLVDATDGGPPTKAAFQSLDARQNQYDPELLAGVRACLLPLASADSRGVTELPTLSLCPGMQILTDIRLAKGYLFLAAGTHLTEDQVARIRNMGKLFDFIDPIRIKQ